MRAHGSRTRAMKNRATTIDRILLVDAEGAVFFDAAGRVVSRVPASASTIGSVARLLDAAPLRGARVLVASADVFRQVVRVPRAQVDGLSAEELESVLFYEIEPFTDLPREGGVLAHRLLADPDTSTTSWEVVQASCAFLEELRKAVAKAGGRLVGLAAAPEGWRSQDDATASLAASALAGFKAGAPPLAFAMPPPRRLFAEARLLPIAGALCALFALAVAADYGWLRHQRARLSPELGERERLNGENERVLRGISANERKAKELAATRARIQEGAKRLDAARSAWPSLLGAISRTGSDRGVLVSIDGGFAKDTASLFQAVLSGVGASVASVDLHLEQLVGELDGTGWSLQPRSIAPSSDGRSVRFQADVVFEPGKVRTDGEATGGTLQ